ncbi:Hypothetical protein GLP15_3466 [Giardia lamblia P15]|uniref:Uncharacterized protein n=1 Tax=Giardia intestinalis (strain P15) TaxID=658858 RepID=E1F0D7_GIAIA|nr:Hypothetical protein GLP15_3466 [Giardia lamblia P15]
MQGPSFSEALRLASYCPPPVQPTFPLGSPGVFTALHSPPSSSIKTPSLATASSTDYPSSTSLSSALPASAPPPQASVHPLLNPSPTTSWGVRADYSRGKQFNSLRSIPPSLSTLREKRSEIFNKESTSKAHQVLAVQQDHLHPSTSASTTSNFMRPIDDSSTLSRQGLTTEGETRMQLLDLQRKYDVLIARLDQKTMTSESLTEELRFMQEDLDKTRKGCVTLANIVHEIAYDEFQSPLSSHNEFDNTSVTGPSVDTSAIAYTVDSTTDVQPTTKLKHKNVIKSDDLVHSVDLTRTPDSIHQVHEEPTSHNTLLQSSLSAALKAASIKTPSQKTQLNLAKATVRSSSSTPMSHTCDRETTVKDTPISSISENPLRSHRLLPSPNTSIPSSSGSSRASSRKSSGRRSFRKSSSRTRRKRNTSNQLHIIHRKQIPMLADLITSTEAELRSFQQHLDEVLKIAKEDPNRTWERGEEIRLLCQAISAKKSALSKLWILRGETDKALDAMESDINQIHALGQRIQARLKAHDHPQSAHAYRSNSAKLANLKAHDGSQTRRLSKSARVSSANTIENIYPLESGTRARPISASKRHEKCIARPVFEQFRARPNPFPP